MNDIINTSRNSSPQIMDNPFIVVPENKEINRISLKNGKSVTFCPLYILTFLMSGPIVGVAISNLPQLIPIFVIAPTLIL